MPQKKKAKKMQHFDLHSCAAPAHMNLRKKVVYKFFEEQFKRSPFPVFDGKWYQKVHRFKADGPQNYQTSIQSKSQMKTLFFTTCE